jgi:endonuclease YncB( thermonuclease family)
VALLPVEDSKKRQDLEKRAKTGDLSSRQLRKLAQKAAASAVAGPVKSPVESQLKPLRRPIDLALHTCQRVADKASSILKMKTGRVLVDLGFFVCRTLSKDDAARVTITDTPSYTYAVTVERVIDGDTLLVLVDLGFDTVVRERLRLRGINTPELKTPEGDKAKAYVFGFLPPGCPVVIKSHETDDYGRFVADVLYFHLDSSPKEIIESGVYLNQQLLDEGVAVRMAE